MTTNILSEYLVRLGFKIDQPQAAKFDKALRTADLSAARLGKTLLGVAARAQAMVTTFSFSMEKLYYASQRAGTTVGNLQALDYAGRGIGLEAGAMARSVEGLARAMRSNPGVQALLENLGVPVQGRDMSDVALDMVQALSKMPAYNAERYGQLFGQDPDTLNVMMRNLDVLRSMAAERKQMAENANVDADRAARSAKQYAAQLREIYELVGLLKDAAAVGLLPLFDRMAERLKTNLRILTDLIRDATDRGWLAQARDVWAEWLKDAVKVVAQVKSDPAGVLQRLREGLFGSDRQGVQLTPQAAARVSDPATLFAGIERKYGLPPGLLDKMYDAESGRGKNLVSPKGAQGPFQLMPATQKEFGVRDPFNLQESADATGRKMSGLLRYYRGDLARAAAGWNWGEGNLDRYGLGNAPAETRGFVSKVAGVQLQQTNNITVTGVSDPASAALQVGKQLDRTSADLTRNLRGAVQ